MTELARIDGYWCRQGTVDANAVYSLADDEYRLWGERYTGWAIDVGAQIGTVGIELARRNPGLRVICVEAVPESSDLLERNIEAFGLGDRVVSVRAWAGKPGQLTGTCHYGYRGGDVESPEYVSAHRFVGNTWVDRRDPEHSIELPAVSLDGLIDLIDQKDYGPYTDKGGPNETHPQHDPIRISVLKIDCEGCEWGFLASPEIWRVDLITGEYHGGYPGHPAHVKEPAAAIVALLSATHDVTVPAVDPIVGMFEAVRR